MEFLIRNLSNEGGVVVAFIYFTCMKRNGNFPTLSVKKVKYEAEEKKVFEEKGGLKRKPETRSDTRKKYEQLKADAVQKRDGAANFPGELDKYRTRIGKDGEVAIRQLPTGPDGKLPPWDPDVDIKDLKTGLETPKVGNDYVCACFGKRRTGKTWIARHLLYMKRQVFNHGIVITKTKFNGFWQNYFPKSVVHGTYDPKIIEEFMLLSLEIEDYNRAHPDKQVNNRSVIVLDDVIADKHVRYDDTLATLFYNGRHFGVFLIICSQYVFGLPPGLRSNSDLVFVLRQFQKRQRDQLNEDFADMLEDDAEFFEALDKNTEDNGCVVIDISNPSNPIERMFYSWKAEDPGLFEIGSYVWKKQVWEEGEEEEKAAYTCN